ncbi:hypothetical protein [Sphingomonas aerophila]|jgi:hypothetical protein|uniref:Uncharacterized protein n=1 Tax=Sphingomonas aerophila TaxID=1344948 RepID=A0A7W9BG15_9SPHN|nr:hypothetical protein [Sphingomonas aerophila]MBB5716575.1 hypothetical protein [Sphingomonas aerophila]
MAQALVDTSTIPGWGVDTDPKNNPTYPMRHIEDQKTRGLTWHRPPLQEPQVEVLQSIEHNRLPAVVGTSTPPSGLSGAIRRYAFRRSESDWWHWLLLMGADRINVVEGVIEDLAAGKVPNVPAEMGAKSEWQHNKNGFLLKAGATLAIGAVLVAIVQARREDRADEDEGETIAAEPAHVTARVDEPVLPADLATSQVVPLPGLDA